MIKIKKKSKEKRIKAQISKTKFNLYFFMGGERKKKRDSLETNHSTIDDTHRTG